MSSAITLIFDEPVSAEAWISFCLKNYIHYSPNTVGQGTFYYGGRSGVQISLDGEGSVQHRPDGSIDWSTAHPPETFSRMEVSSFVGQNLEVIGAIARGIAAEFPCMVSPDAELAHTVIDLPQAFEEGDHYEQEADLVIPTDDESGWAQDGNVMTAKVSAGAAVIRRESDMPTVQIDGIKRGTFRELKTAMAFASRCTWDWWGGPQPDEVTDDSALSLPKP